MRALFFTALLAGPLCSAQAARPDAGAAASPARAVGVAGVEGKYSVKLESFGTAKIQCIKLVRDATGLGLADTKKLVESAPVIVKGNLSKEAAEKLAAELEKVGGKASAVLAGD